MEPPSYLLVVEDCSETRYGLKQILEAAGYQVICAADGREALDLVRRLGPPALVLLDLSMPVMDGRQFRDRLRRSPELASVPVVLHSGESDLAEVAASLGVAGYLPKPVEAGVLLRAIRSFGRAPEPAAAAG